MKTMKRNINALMMTKKMTKTEKQIRELLKKQTELRAAMAEQVENAEDFGKLEREYNANKRALECLSVENTLSHNAETPDASGCLRELLRGARDGKQAREVVLLKKATPDKTSIEESGAVNLTIRDIIPTLDEGGVLEIPGLQMVTGVTGNELYPVSIDDADLEEVGEVASLTDQDLHFDEIRVTPGRAGLSVAVSNMAIDNAAFDLLAFVQGKFTAAIQRYAAKKVLSRAEWSGIKGPFSGITASGSIALDSDAYANILKAVAAFADKGFNTDEICLVVDASTEAALKATPKAAGQGGFVIENGTLAGYPYVVNHYINTTLDSSGKLVPTTDKVLGIGFFRYLALQQHGEVRLTVDATSKAVAIKNCTAVVLNTSFSVTDLSTKLNGSTTGKPQAFAVYTLTEPASTAKA